MFWLFNRPFCSCCCCCGVLSLNLFSISFTLSILSHPTHRNQSLTFLSFKPQEIGRGYEAYQLLIFKITWPTRPLETWTYIPLREDYVGDFPPSESTKTQAACVCVFWAGQIISKDNPMSSNRYLTSSLEKDVISLITPPQKTHLFLIFPSSLLWKIIKLHKCVLLHF